MKGAHRVGRPELLLVVISLAVSLGLCELAARRAFLLPFNPLADGWWEVSWLKRSSRGAEQYAIDRYDPLLGWTLRENLRDAPLAGATVNSNSRGVRGRREYAIGKAGRFRAVVIGDSYTFGEGVNDDETFSAFLERQLPGSDIINLGVHGYGTDQQLLRLQRDGLPYRPDVIVFGYYEDDISRNRMRFRDYLKPHFSIVNDRLELDNDPIPSPEDYKARLHVRSLGYLNIFMTRLRERRLEADNVERSKRLLAEIAAQARRAAATLVTVYLPTPDQVRDNETAHPGLFSYTCALPDVVCVDPTASLHRVTASAPDWRSLFRYHYAPELHQVIAQELAREILPWR